MQQFVANSFVEDVQTNIEYELPVNRMDMEAYMESTLLTNKCQSLDSKGLGIDHLIPLLSDERIRVTWNFGEGNILVNLPNTILGHVLGTPVLMNFRTGRKIFSYVVKQGETRRFIVYWAIDGDIYPFFLLQTRALNSRTVDLLKAYLNKHSIDKLDMKLFATSKLLRRKWVHYRRLAYEKFKDPEILKIRLYDLRHWFGTTEYIKTRDIFHIKYLMGHRNIQSTLHYMHVAKGLVNYCARVLKSPQGRQFKSILHCFVQQIRVHFPVRYKTLIFARII